MVSEELVKKYLDHLKHLHFSKVLRNQATVEKRRNREAKRYKDYNWGELLLTGELKSLCVFEHLLVKRLPSVQKKTELKNEKIGLITSHLQEVRGQPTLGTMTVPFQCLSQANEPT